MKHPMRFAFLSLTFLFFIWGFITVVVDAFIPRLKEVFELSYGEAGLVQVAWFLAYLLVSIPGGILVSKIGYKNGIISGLILAGLGCWLFYPAAHMRYFPLFLLALFILASGITILQVAANPFVSVLGPENKAASRLNLSQAFNSLGTTIAPIFSATFLLSDSIKSSVDISTLTESAKNVYFTAEAAAVQNPFLFLGATLVVIALIFKFIHLPKILDGHHGSSFKEALKHRNLRLGIVGIFVYVGAEVAIGSFLINYFLSMNMQAEILNSPVLSKLADIITTLFSGLNFDNLDEKAIVGAFVIFYWGGAMVGRFIGSYLTIIFPSARVLQSFTLLAILLLIFSMTNTGLIAMWCTLGVGFFNSIMFPTIFTMSLQGLGDSKPHGSGLLCTAIFGGAIIPPLFGVAIDNFGFNLAFTIPILCYAFIFYFGKSASPTSQV